MSPSSTTRAFQPSGPTGQSSGPTDRPGGTEAQPSGPTGQRGGPADQPGGTEAQPSELMGQRGGPTGRPAGTEGQPSGPKGQRGGSIEQPSQPTRQPGGPKIQPIVIWFGRVGDLILLSTLFDILHRRYGKPCRLVGAGAWTTEIYRTHRDVAQISCLRRYTPFVFDLAWWRTRWALRRNRSGPVYVCEYDSRKLKKIRRLLAFSGIAPERCLFITEQASYHEAHWVDRLVSFGRRTPPGVSEADYPWPTANPPLCAPRLEVSATVRTECEAWIAAQGWSDRPLILVQPGNRRTMRGNKLRLSPLDDKAWPVERWAELLKRVHAHMPEAIIVLCGAPRETLLLGWIHAAVQMPTVVYTAEIPLGRLLALCEAAHSMISVDTGPAHAAAALSLPLVVLFGGHSQAEWLPRSPSGSPVIGIGGPPTSTRLDQISAEAVFKTWLTLLERRREWQKTSATPRSPDTYVD